ncbi:hypothetical protein TRVA0_002S01948 [Trichomonascus vanleenenianus]|uniref:uncharacterized protein n=1 Tax=Trichomonascus vanleenenianus TaxID=2268995 RepID=UPI003ECB206C
MSQVDEVDEEYLNRHAEWALASALRQYLRRSGEKVTREWIRHCAQSIKYFIDWRLDKPDKPPAAWVDHFIAQYPDILSAPNVPRDKPAMDRIVEGLFRKLKSIAPDNIAYLHVSEFEYGIEQDELYCRIVKHDADKRTPLSGPSSERFVVIDGVRGDGKPLKKKVLVGAEEAELAQQFRGEVAIEQYSPEHSVQFYWVRHFAQQTERTSDPFQTRYLIVNQSEVPSELRYQHACQHILERNCIELIIVPDEISYFTQVLYTLHFDPAIKMLRNTRVYPAEPIADKRVQRRLWLSMFLPGTSQSKLKDAMGQIGIVPYDKVLLMYQALPFSALENTCVVWAYPLRVLLTLELERNYVRPKEHNARFEKIREQVIGAFTPFDADIFDTDLSMLDTRGECIYKTHLLTGELLSPFQGDDESSEGEPMGEELSSSELSELSDENLNLSDIDDIVQKIVTNDRRGGSEDSHGLGDNDQIEHLTNDRDESKDTNGVGDIDETEYLDTNERNGTMELNDIDEDYEESENDLGESSNGGDDDMKEVEGAGDSTKKEELDKDELGLATGLIDHIWESVLANLKKPSPSMEELQRDIPVLHKSFVEIKSIIDKKLRGKKPSKRRQSEPHKLRYGAPMGRGLNQTSGIRPSFRRSLPNKPSKVTK